MSSFVCDLTGTQLVQCKLESCMWNCSNQESGCLKHSELLSAVPTEKTLSYLCDVHTTEIKEEQESGAYAIQMLILLYKYIDFLRPLVDNTLEVPRFEVLDEWPYTHPDVHCCSRLLVAAATLSNYRQFKRECVVRYTQEELLHMDRRQLTKIKKWVPK